MSVVYQATNLVNGKRYIGVTTYSMHKRRREHECNALSGSALYFHRAIRKYGKASFLWEEIEAHGTHDELMRAEIRLIEKLSPEYNLTKGGEGILGYKRSPESIEKTAIAHRGRKRPVETCQKISAIHNGKKLSDEQKHAIGIALKGRKLTLEHRFKISEGNRKRWKTRSSVTELRPHGEAHVNSKLNDQIIMEIRATEKIPGVGRRLAQQFGVSPSIISQIINDKAWRHVPSDGSKYLTRHGASKLTPHGEAHHNSKLNDEIIREIRSTTKSYGVVRRLSQRFGVATGVISSIRNGKAWRHVSLDGG